MAPRAPLQQALTEDLKNEHDDCRLVACYQCLTRQQRPVDGAAVTGAAVKGAADSSSSELRFGGISGREVAALHQLLRQPIILDLRLLQPHFYTAIRCLTPLPREIDANHDLDDGEEDQDGWDHGRVREFTAHGSV